MWQPSQSYSTLLFVQVVLIVSFTAVSTTNTTLPFGGREANLSTVSTNYGDLQGSTYNASDSYYLDVFLGIPYAQPPVGDLRFAAPLSVTAWSPDTRNATEHGAQCKGQMTYDPELPGVPYSEDCLFIDIYAPRHKDESGTLLPVMVYIHPGGYNSGTGAKYNYTNLALKGVVVVVVSYRLDVLGFISTQDELIPGNFGVLDTILALNFTKEIIAEFGGDPNDITLFGNSAGAAIVSILTLSPLTRGTFQKAIVQSGPSLARWSVYPEGREAFVPREVAQTIGLGLNCSLPSSIDNANFSRDLLACLRAVDVDLLLAESLKIQLTTLLLTVVPVFNDTFGLLPESIEDLMSDEAQMVAIPMIWGFTSQDGAWLVMDLENDGLTLQEFQDQVVLYLPLSLPTALIQSISERTNITYNIADASTLSQMELRDLAIEMYTDAMFEAFTIKQARLFSKATPTAKTYVYELGYRPSYTMVPDWHGVGHSEERGFVLGHPVGPDPYGYPTTTPDDDKLADYMTTMWSNFAKYGDPTPEPIDGVRWPEFGHSPNDQEILLIQPQLEVITYDRDDAVIAWTGDSGIVDSTTEPGPDSAESITLTPWLLVLAFVALNLL